MTILFYVFSLATVIQSAYLCAFLMAFRRKRPESPPQPTRSVSVVVCAFDEEKNLRELLPLLLTQDHPSFEVVVVNDRSNDSTQDYLIELSQMDNRIIPVQVKSLPDHVNGKKYALTLGIKAANHEYILLTDADCRPIGPTWIATMAQQFDPQTQFVLGFSPYLKFPGLLNAFIRYDTFFTGLQYLSLALLGMPYMGVGRNLSYRKSIFLDKKGFTGFLHVTGGDDDLFVNAHATSLNARVCLDKGALVHSLPKTTWKAFINQKIRHLSVGKRYKNRDQFVLGLFWVSHWAFWIGFLGLITFGLFSWEATLLFLLRMGLLMLALRTLLDSVGEKFEIWKAMFLDFPYSIYYLTTGLSAFLMKKIQWTS